MEQYSDKEVQLLNDYPNIFSEVKQTLKLAYWFFALSLAGWVIGGLYLLITLSSL